jgi:general stress protein CsbA
VRKIITDVLFPSILIISMIIITASDWVPFLRFPLLLLLMRMMFAGQRRKK